MINIPLGSGADFKNQEDLIERVAVSKAYQYNKIGFLDVEDLKQEVRIKCLSIIDKYDPSCGTNLFVFLSVCADRRLKDLRRSLIYKHNKPCTRCPFWDEGAASSGLHDCSVYYNKIDCSKFAKHERYITAKLSSSQPMDIESQNIEDSNFSRSVKTTEIVELIESKLPQNLLGLFRKFKNNNFDIKSLKPKERNNLLSTLRNLVNIKDFI